MGVEKNVVANMESGSSIRYFDAERGQWEWRVGFDSDYMLRTPDPIVSITDERSYKKRLYCEYCGCISEKDHGTCEHCGAPLKEME